MSADEHRRRAAGTPASCAVVTVSDTRTEADDTSGTLARDRLHAAGHAVEFYRIVPDDPEKIRAVLVHLAGRVEVVLTTGGTGIAYRDRTIEVAESLILKPIPGFGELFRHLSYAQVGPAAMLSRAVAGLYGAPSDPEAPQSLLFCCPGSTDAVALALDHLIVPELSHLVWETLRQRPVPPATPV
ncbi:MAG TPA: molybdenum cofactor biosynthesis protein B [Rhodothermales bacterium]|nr:molybdenum cofactor biosynthesis protein B [Rhodothermales bacterium]